MKRKKGQCYRQQEIISGLTIQRALQDHEGQAKHIMSKFFWGKLLFGILKGSLTCVGKYPVCCTRLACWQQLTCQLSAVFIAASETAGEVTQSAGPGSRAPLFSGVSQRHTSPQQWVGVCSALSALATCSQQAPAFCFQSSAALLSSRRHSSMVPNWFPWVSEGRIKRDLSSSYSYKLYPTWRTYMKFCHGSGCCFVDAWASWRAQRLHIGLPCTVQFKERHFPGKRAPCCLGAVLSLDRHAVGKLAGRYCLWNCRAILAMY